MCRPHFKTRLLPNKGTASDVAGIVSATIFRNTVKDNKIVTPKKKEEFEYCFNKYVMVNFKNLRVHSKELLKKIVGSIAENYFFGKERS